MVIGLNDIPFTSLDKPPLAITIIAAELWLRGRIETLEAVFQTAARNFTIRLAEKLAKYLSSLMRRAETLATQKRNAISTPRTGFGRYELIRAATESANVSWDRVPSGLVKVVVTAVWKSSSSQGGAQVLVSNLIASSTWSPSSRCMPAAWQYWMVTSCGNFVITRVTNETLLLHGSQSWLQNGVVIPSPTDLTPEKWKQTATLCPLDWPSNCSLLRLWHVTKDLHQFMDQLRKQMNHRYMFLIGKSTIKSLRAEWSTSYRLIGVLVAQLVWRHSCVADRLPVVVRFPVREFASRPLTRRKATGSGKKN